jgi:hypothetical protein
MRESFIGVMGLTCLLLCNCSSQDGVSTERSKEIQSVLTDLNAASCKKDFDKSDPNETPYLVCPGVAGYTLIVRRVDAGRQSIDVVDATKRVLPLNYQEHVTRHMSTLDGKAEWRVAMKDGKEVPIALIVRVDAREDNGNPEKVTGSYLALAKIGPNEVCVTDRIPEGTKSDAEIRSAADSAQDRQCAPVLPQLAADGADIR